MPAPSGISQAKTLLPLVSPPSLTLIRKDLESLLASYRRGKNRGLGKRWEKAMATYSSSLAWKIPWTEEPARLQFMGPLRIGHD